ncbi:S-layer homology domain-containing protein [Oceanobacillus limi]|uniref:S-layer homology domain-containing protein n=1 Tax=Oceanobacillus limi TaxID=930131 RepID=A0A1I0A2S4_9BACI|nr:S-layer homology domain-containing protein [Oceanobacillus limi]SES88442.1 S-layer homology domain-containing protein [Oceanobacillus limi]
MKKMFTVMLLLIILLSGMQGVAADATQPPIDEVKQIITEKAIAYDIPPEILKAIAYEESGYRQFQNGEPYISEDGGIGIMQVTPEKIDIVVDEERLKYDIEYNIEIGASVLDSKWDLTYLPSVNNQDREVLEEWYFPITAYNGLSKRNDPNLHPGDTYQEDVYSRIEGSSLIYWSGSHFEFPEFDIRYDTGDDTMKFPPGVSYTTMTITPSQQMYQPGDLIYIDGRDGAINFRSSLAPNADITKLIPYTPLEVVDGPFESSNINNDFSYYKLEGISADGYASSAYLNQANQDFTFSDPITDERAAALYFLAMNEYVTGFQDGSFGSEEPLRREHVAVILDRILDMEMPSDYEMQADDVSENNPYYDALAKAEYNGYLGVGGKLRPQEYLTRSQMASVLVRAFDAYYQEPTEDHVFEDQSSIWNYEPINTLYFNEITIADPYRPNEDVTRSQFALFIYRTLVE